MVMKKGETLKTYSDRYWEMFNEIEGDFEDVAIWTFKVDLPTDHNLRKSLTMKPAQIDKHKWIEEDQQQGKGKAKIAPPGRRYSWTERYNHNRSRRDFASHLGHPNA